MKTVEISKLMCVNKNDLILQLNNIPIMVVLQLHSYYIITLYSTTEVTCMCDTRQKYAHSFLT